MPQALLNEIIELEWVMFSTVANVGGRADCQEDPETFRIMRCSQIRVWPEGLLKSWLGDLRRAERDGRNLMSEKYARMMETTFPGEYKALAGSLPSLDKKTLAKVEEIIAINVAWKLESASRYPALNGQGRPVRTREDSRLVTSFETYLRGELRTYSTGTIRLLHNYTRMQKKAGVNGAETTLLTQVRMYGYASLDEAEKAVARNRLN